MAPSAARTSLARPQTRMRARGGCGPQESPAPKALLSVLPMSDRARSAEYRECPFCGELVLVLDNARNPSKDAYHKVPLCPEWDLADLHEALKHAKRRPDLCPVAPLFEEEERPN